MNTSNAMQNAIPTPLSALANNTTTHLQPSPPLRSSDLDLRSQWCVCTRVSHYDVEGILLHNPRVARLIPETRRILLRDDDLHLLALTSFDEDLAKSFEFLLRSVE